MNTVDKEKASDKARNIADEALYLCYPPHAQNSMEAQAYWACVFKREFHALTQPTPYAQEGQG